MNFNDVDNYYFNVLALGMCLENGEIINIEDAPHQVIIKSNNSDFFCGGGLISREHVLTVKQCVRLLDRENLSVTLMGNSTDSKCGSQLKVTEVIDISESSDLFVLVVSILSRLTFSYFNNCIHFSDRNICLCKIS